MSAELSCHITDQKEWDSITKFRTMNQLPVFAFLVILAASSALRLLPPLPQNKMFIEGETMIITCTAGDSSAYPNITYGRKDEYGDFLNVKPNERINMTSIKRNDTAQGLLVTSSVLHVKSVKLADADDSGQWHCIALVPGKRKDELGFTINVISKRHLPKGVIRGGGTIPYGGTANLTCDVTDGTSVIAPLFGLAWMRGNVILKNGSSQTVLEPLIIKDAATRDGGPYKCVGIANFRRSQLRPLTLDTATLYIGMMIDIGSTNVSGDLSTAVIMDCPAEGFPLDVTWWRTDKDGRQVQIVDSDRFTLIRPCSSCKYRLKIKDLQPSDVGYYSCQAKQNTTSGMHRFSLSLEEIIIDRGVTEIAALESSNVTMVCPVEGEATNVTWWKMNKERERKQLENSERFVVFRPCNSCQYRLTIINIQRNDTGHYLCQANRNLDSGIHHFKLSLKNPEEKPTVGSFAVIDSAKFLLILSGALFTWITMY